jgi:hypothetical protein
MKGLRVGERGTRRVRGGLDPALYEEGLRCCGWGLLYHREPRRVWYVVARYPNRLHGAI